MFFFHTIKNIIRQNKCSKGLTILETLVSVAIISLTIIGPLSFISTSSSYARQAKEGMVASYLAEEAVELVQNQYDSLYVGCLHQLNTSVCMPIAGETTNSETAWRLFKQRMGTNGANPSCFMDNLDGCSFDYIDAEIAFDLPLTKYDGVSAECGEIISRSASGLTTYVCKGVPSRTTGLGVVLGNKYKRTIHLERMDTFEVDAPIAERDYDEVRVMVNVSYKAVNGSTRTITIVRYIFPRP